MRIVVAMSGGVDSSVAAALLAAEGHDVIGLSMQLYDQTQGDVRFGSCCTIDDLYDARNVSTLRTTMVLSYLGMCSISLPLRGPDGRSTVGLMASLPHGEDDRLLAVAQRLAKYPDDQSV